MSQSDWNISHEAGHGDLQKVVLFRGERETSLNVVEVYLFGATLTSWVSEGRENIYVSPDSLWNGVKAIRGGIPIVFPQFGQPGKTTFFILKKSDYFTSMCNIYNRSNNATTWICEN
jgi:hypothetical protein